MSVIVVDNESKYASALLELLRDKSPTVIGYKDLDYRNFSKNDTVILTGGHGYPILWHDKEYAKEAELIKKHKGPVIGICLGFELIAHIYSSHLHRLNKRRKGEIEVFASCKSPFAIPSKIKVYENHNWSVEKVKRPLVPIAYSKDGIEIFKHSRKRIYGLQFHPEKSSSETMALFKEILASVDA